MLYVSGNILQQMEKFNYLGVVAYLRVTEGRARILIHVLVKLTQFCVSFIALWSQNASFQTLQICQLLNRSLFQSLPKVMNQGRIQPVRLGGWGAISAIFGS